MMPLNETLKLVALKLLFASAICGLSVSVGQAENLKATTSASNLKQTSPAPTKSSINTNIYEKDEQGSSFSDTVKLVRTMEDTTQVMFNKMPGFFSAPSDGAAMNALLESQKNKTGVSVTIDDDTRRIMKVRAAAVQAP